jgi:hypothetical protein
LIIISKARVNIKVKEIPKVIIVEVIPKILREVYTETTKVFFREEVIPKTFSNIILRNTRSIINQGVSPRTI